MLNDFLQQIVAHLPPPELSTTEKGIWIYQHHFIPQSRSSEGDCPVGSETETADENDAFLHHLHTLCEPLYRWVPISAEQWHAREHALEYGGVTLQLQPDEWRDTPTGGDAWLPYYAMGDDGWIWIEPFPSPQHTVSRSRCYLPLRTTGALQLIETMPSLLTSACPPFRIKLAVPRHYYRIRRDTCLLYLHTIQKDTILHTLSPMLHEIYQAGGFLPETIPLTSSVIPGVYYAEEPDNGMSFGQHRCHLIAQGLARCRPPVSMRDLAHAARAVFYEAGISWEQPWRRRSTNHRRL